MSEAADNRQMTRDNMARSRAEIRRLLDPPTQPQDKAADGRDAATETPSDAAFPRSKTMRKLLTLRGLGTMGALLGGLVLARPALALKLLRMVPTGAVARMLLVKALASFRANAPR